LHGAMIRAGSPGRIVDPLRSFDGGQLRTAARSARRSGSTWKASRSDEWKLKRQCDLLKNFERN
jgi:hypothetical protein